MNIDPLAEAQESFTPYHFGYNNPIALNDPSGLMPDPTSIAPIHRESYGLPEREFNPYMIAKCDNCPKTAEFAKYHNSDNNYYYHNGDVSNLLPEATASSSSQTPTNAIERFVNSGGRHKGRTISYHMSDRSVERAAIQHSDKLIADLSYVAWESISTVLLETYFAAAGPAGEFLTEYRVLYRGINSGTGRIAFTNGLKGIAKPRGGIFGHLNPLKHNKVLNGTVKSSFTSWSTNRQVALNFALRTNGSGVVLSKAFPAWRLVKSPNTKDVLIYGTKTVVSESEVLIWGPVRRAATKILTH